MHTGKMFGRIVILLLIFSTSLMTCATPQSKIDLPSPDRNCKVNLDWHGLNPGQSTREDVIEEFGEPFEEGRLRFDDEYISYYAYKVESGKVSEYVVDRIFFRSDGLVDWMEIVEADKSGAFETLYNTVLQLGNTVDTIYSNSNFKPKSHLPDVVAGPDRIYVWSECGIALDVLPSTYSRAFQGNDTECQSDEEQEACKLFMRHPNPYNVGIAPQPDVNSVILLRYYFQPTSFEGFAQHYMYKIPYGLWKEYIAENR